MHLTADLRSAFRSLAKRPATTALVVLILALGIGANTAMFSIVNAVLLRPLPFERPSELAMVWLDNRVEGWHRDITSYPNFLDWRQNQSFEALAGYRPLAVALTSGGEPIEVQAATVTANFFSTLGVPPARGRGFTAEEEQEGKDQVVVLSHRLWKGRFGGDPGLVGRAIELGGESHTVVGIAPPSLDFPAGTEVWAPLAPDEGTRSARGSLWLYVVGRLRPGVTLAAAQVEMTGIAERLEREYPQLNRELGINLVPLQKDLVGEVRPALLVLLAAVFAVLLIACANLANLLLARAGEREQEFALRSALGAGRRRLLTQLLWESLVLAGLGGLGGVLLAAWASPLLLAWGARELPRLPAGGLDLPVLLFTLGVSLATGIAFGLAPGLHLARARLGSSLKEAGRGAQGGRKAARLRRVLVAAEVALAMVLLVGAGLLVRSLGNLGRVDMGLAAEGRLTFRLQLPPTTYPTRVEVRRFYEELLARLETLPGVRSAGAASAVLIGRLPSATNVTIEGIAPQGALDQRSVALDAVSPRLFEVAGMPLVRGRAFDATDGPEVAPVAIVNEAMVRQFWKGQDALGRRFKYGSATSQDPWRTVIGVVADTRRSGADQEVMPATFLPLAQVPRRSMMVVVHAEGDPMALAPAIQKEVWSLDETLPVSSIATLQKLLDDRLGPRRFQVLLLGLFASLALVLAVVGIYGVVSYLVELQAGEIGVRMALGAGAERIAKMVVRQVLALVGPGLALGLAGGLLLSRFLRSFLFGISALDPATFAAVALLLATVAIAAGLLPARRAARLDPVEVLRKG
ncbi:MAG TPA: ABC transporter permease [Thermoanaerobaculia bacterium]|nr:ABC transporter permease [Thermoanaerobaculia bacterium]